MRSKKIDCINLFFLNTIIMLLNDLIALFSVQLNIDQVQFNNIIETNNIKLNQKLVLDKKKLTKHDTTQYTTQDTKHEANSTEKRSRGRPRKQCNIISTINNIPEDVDYEIVEEITYKNSDYFKTDKGVLLDANYKACGLIVDGLVIMK
jgi:hypothetical protein